VQPDAASPRTPHESTVGLLSSAEAEPSPAAGSDAPRLKPGQSLAGRFTVLRFIASGGMGAVYEATDVMLRTHVALKVIRAPIASDATTLERFRREVLLARRVGHANVCRVYELYEATADGVTLHFLTMELLKGETLAKRLATKGHLKTAEAAPLVKQMCEGLAAAHAEGVIHRDFKSSNVMLVPKPDGQSDRVVITDFGVAHAVGAASGEASEEPLTGGAGILGTPEYMAPEQVTGGEVTAAADVYALGVVLYEMVTGKLPFAGDTPLAAAAKRLNEAPPGPEEAVPDLDTRWASAIRRCMAREPGRRFKSTLDVAEALDRTPSRWPRVAKVAATLAALGIGALAVAHYGPQAQRGRPKPVLVTKPRPVLAILGIRNEVPSPGLAWAPTALEEFLHQELAAAETSLRVIPTDRVTEARRSLGIPVDAVSELDARSRLQALLVPNLLLHGKLGPAQGHTGELNLELHLVDGATGKERLVLQEPVRTDELAETVSRLGEKLRQALSVRLSEEERETLYGARLSVSGAGKPYAEGLAALRSFDYSLSRNLLQVALAEQPSLVLAARRVIESWSGQGDRKKARELLKTLLPRPGLRREERGLFSIQLFTLNEESEKALEAAAEPLASLPDDLELGLFVLRSNASRLNPQAELALVRRLKQLPPPASEDVRLQIEEAQATWRNGDLKGARVLFDSAKAHAKQLGARSEEAAALLKKAIMMWLGEVRGEDAVFLLEEAGRLSEGTGDLEERAQISFVLAALQTNEGPIDRALAALTTAAALNRRLGNHEVVGLTLLGFAEVSFRVGDFEAGDRALADAKSEFEAMNEPLSFQYFAVQAHSLVERGDFPRFRLALQGVRNSPDSLERAVLELQGRALEEQDHLQEAEAAFARIAALEAGQGASGWSSSLRHLCSLKCEAGAPEAGLACLASSPDAERLHLLQGQFMAVSEAAGRLLVKSQCEFLSGQFGSAQQDALRAAGLAGEKGMTLFRLLCESEAARAAGHNGEAAGSMRALRKALADAQGLGAKRVALEASLALGEVEVRAGVQSGRARLEKLEREATHLEFFRIARLAREAREGALSKAHATAPAR
jgi:tRNA A-37 threonylcarbamoyl transferase component Bud32